MQQKTTSFNYEIPVTLKASMVKPLQNLNTELFKRINAAFYQQNMSEVNKLLDIISGPEMFIAIALEIEKNHGKEKVEDFWLAGLERFQRSLVFLEALGFFFFRLGRVDLSLRYLKKCLEAEPTAAAIKIAIICAYELAQFHLIWHYYSLFSADDRDNLEREIVWQVAQAAIELEMFREAEMMLQQVRDRLNLKSLPTLEKTVQNYFSSDEERLAWADEMNSNLEDQKTISKKPLKDWLTYGSLLMLEDRYQDAYLALTRVKKALT